MKLFRTPEYDIEQSKFVYAGVRQLMRAKDELFASIRTEEEGEAIPISQNSFGAGAVVQNEPVMMQAQFVIPFDEIRECSFDSLLFQMDKAADENLKVAMGFMFETFRKTSDAAGTAFDAKGEALSHEMFLRVLEGMEISFDANGEARMPTLVVHPDMAEKLRALPPETPEQIAARKKIIDRKRQEHNARKRTRKLH